MPTTYGGGAMGGSPSYPEGTGPEEEEGEAEKQPSLEIVRDHSSNKIVLLRCALFLGFLGIIVGLVVIFLMLVFHAQ